MSQATFPLALKSTLDFISKGIADAKGLPFLDLDSSEFESAITESDQPAICWVFTSMDEAPFDPMYSASFEIGSMTSLDPSQYVSLDITGAISATFKVGQSYDIFDYSGDLVSPERVGQFYIVSTGLAPASQDHTTNVRFLSVHIRVIRYDND